MRGNCRVPEAREREGIGDEEVAPGAELTIARIHHPAEPCERPEGIRAERVIVIGRSYCHGAPRPSAWCRSDSGVSDHENESASRRVSASGANSDPRFVAGNAVVCGRNNLFTVGCSGETIRKHSANGQATRT